MLTDELVTVADMERATKLGFRTIKRRLGELRPVRRQGNEIFFSTREALPLLCAAGKEQDTFDLTQQRARLAKVQADKIELETKRMTKELVDLGEFSEEFGKYLISLRDALKNMGLVLSEQVAGKSAPQAYELIQSYTSEQLARLAQEAQNLFAKAHDESPS